MARFQFSLRTLLIVVTLLAIPCGYVGWQAKVVRDRAEALEWLHQQHAGILERDTYGGHNGTAGYGEWWVYLEDYRLPWYRKFLDDHYVAEVRYLDESTVAELERVKAAFPEAIIHQGSGAWEACF